MTIEEVLKNMQNGGHKVNIANFHRTVPSAEGVPEYAFYHDHPKSSRRAIMLLTPYGLLCEQKGSVTLVPLSNLVYAR